MKMERYLRTKDLGEAAALDAVGLPMVGLEPNGDGKSFNFIFAEADRSATIARQYWSGELSVPARSYADSMRRLKDRLFARR
jgi:hypothetical protein